MMLLTSRPRLKETKTVVFDFSKIVARCLKIKQIDGHWTWTLSKFSATLIDENHNRLAMLVLEISKYISTA
jgi:hypothetical protein